MAQCPPSKYHPVNRSRYALSRAFFEVRLTDGLYQTRMRIFLFRRCVLLHLLSHHGNTNTFTAAVRLLEAAGEKR